ncbi:MAG: S-layer homology domain-containing protein [Oscillospiraceae bacterium]|nr:S-layer homology domain-containing protein [Oscillospiraceae bacterium]
MRKFRANRKTTAIFVSLAFVLALIHPIGLIPGVRAAGADDLADLINNFDHGGFGTLTAVADGNTVTVTGTVAGVTKSQSSGPNMAITLDINSDVTVIWKAEYSGLGSASLIRLTGSGAFEVAENARIVATQNSSAILIPWNSSPHAVTVRVKDNAWVSGAASGIDSDSSLATIYVEGGTVLTLGSGASGYNAINAASNTNVIVSGGLVETRGNGHGIETSGEVTVNGGIVRARGGLAIAAWDTVTVSGGVMFSYGTTVDDVIAKRNDPAFSPSIIPADLDLSGDGLVIAWDKAAYDGRLAGTPSFFYPYNTSDDLFSDPGTPETLEWDVAGSRDGISYKIGDNEGHVPLPVRVGALRYAIELSQTETLTFPSVFEGYPDMNPRHVTVFNTGNMDTGILQASLSGDDADKFTLTALPSTGLNWDNVEIYLDTEETFMVVPKPNLPSGSYTATVTVEKHASNPNDLEEQSFDVSFTVNELTADIAKVTIEMYDSYGDGWDGNAALIIHINGVTTYRVKEAGSAQETVYFYAEPNDEIVFFWESGTSQSENAFAVYYDQKPPATPFDPSSLEWNPTEHDPDDHVLIFKQYGELTDATEGEHLGEFTAPPCPILTYEGEELEMSLETGYDESVSTDVFTLEGDPGPVRINIICEHEAPCDCEDKIEWDELTMTLTFLTGLEAGTYEIELTAGIFRVDPTLIFTLTVGTPCENPDCPNGGYDCTTCAVCDNPGCNDWNCTDPHTPPVTTPPPTPAPTPAPTEPTTNMELTLTPDMLNELWANAVDGVMVLILEGALENLRIDMPLSWFIENLKATLLVYNPHLGLLAITSENMIELAALSYEGEGGVTVTVRGRELTFLPDTIISYLMEKGSVSLSVSSNGQSLDWYTYDSPIILGIPLDAETADGDPTLRVASGSSKIVALSAMRGGLVYAMVNREGRYTELYNPTSFDDIDPAGSPAGSAVGFMAARGVVSGNGAGLFLPDRRITRAEYITMLMRTIDLSAEEYDPAPFRDVSPESWYHEYVCQAAALGITAGVGNGLFAPDRAVTWEEIYALTYNILVRYYLLLPDEEAPDSLGAFSDAAEISGYARRAVAELAARGLVRETGGRSLPAVPAGRAEAALFLTDVIGYIVPDYSDLITPSE